MLDFRQHHRRFVTAVTLAPRTIIPRHCAVVVGCRMVVGTTFGVWLWYDIGSSAQGSVQAHTLKPPVGTVLTGVERSVQEPVDTFAFALAVHAPPVLATGSAVVHSLVHSLLGMMVLALLGIKAFVGMTKIAGMADLSEVQTAVSVLNEEDDGHDTQKAHGEQDEVVHRLWRGYGSVLYIGLKDDIILEGFYFIPFYAVLGSRTFYPRDYLTSLAS